MTAARQMRLAIAMATTLFCAMQAFAHPPYEHVAGSFTRKDGITISAVEHYIDGILGRDPVAVQFRLPDGTVIAQTDRSSDNVVVKSTRVGFEVYRFPSDWIPIASRVQQFDGYALSEISRSRTYWFSLLTHTRAHWKEYAVAVALAAVLVAGWFVVRTIPKGGALGALRVLGFVSIGFAALLYSLLVLWAAQVSPFILCIFIGICVVLCVPLTRFVRHAKAT